MTTIEDDMIVTPWEVQGQIDYDRLVEEFGTKHIDLPLLKRLQKVTGDLHLQLRRKIVFSHRDFDWIMDKYENGEKFVLYTGRGPSGHVHLGHMIPWFFTKWIQDKFDTRLYFQMTDDEKFIVKDLTLDDTMYFSYENALDILAVGFDPKKTLIVTDSKCINTLYPTALRVAKHINYSTARAVFGFEDTSSIGLVFFPAIQAVPCFLHTVLTSKNTPCLIPASIDQDPYWRVARDVAPRLGFYKPAQIHGKFLPGLIKGGKMSASIPESAIFSVDTPEEAREKVMNAFTGGKATVEEQKKEGGKPGICAVYQYMYFLFEQDDKKIQRLGQRCMAGEILCGECKQILADKVENFLIEHMKRREKAKDVVRDVLVDDEYFKKNRA
jgi:tryptophanyl-tRNA synthetase